MSFAGHLLSAQPDSEALQTVSPQSLQQPWEVRSLDLPILQMKELRFSKNAPYSRPQAGQLWRWDENPGQNDRRA